MYFFIKTRNPRPTFLLDRTAAEHAIMERHVAYWSEKATLGVAYVYGPGMDPGGEYGIGVYDLQTEAEILDLLQHDPARGLLQYEILLAGSGLVGVHSG